ncbi:MAG: molybdenum cofactor guanylyltransferase [Ilumatobacteraceae bacterium]|nr:molybdenum cofactor guanylyltransferase [Ilumatobacteraceae bacterium]
MGSNKATFEVDGIAMAQRVALAATESGASEVLLIGGSQAAAKGISGTWVKDAWPGEGPLGGIITALKNSSNDATIVLSCDMPFLTPAVIHSLLLGLSDAQAAVGRTDRLNWLCSAWSQKQCLSTMLGVWKRNERAVHRAAAILDVIEVPVPANAVRNINSLADLDVSDGSTI